MLTPIHPTVKPTDQIPTLQALQSAQLPLMQTHTTKYPSNLAAKPNGWVQLLLYTFFVLVIKADPLPYHFLSSFFYPTISII